MRKMSVHFQKLIYQLSMSQFHRDVTQILICLQLFLLLCPRVILEFKQQFIIFILFLMLLGRRLLTRQCFWESVDQLSADLWSSQVVDLGQRLRRQILHVGLSVEQELKEDALNLQEHRLDLFLTFAISVHHLIQVYSAVSFQIQAGISFHKNFLLQLDCIACNVSCEKIHLSYTLLRNVSTLPWQGPCPCILGYQHCLPQPWIFEAHSPFEVWTRAKSFWWCLVCWREPIDNNDWMAARLTYFLKLMSNSFLFTKATR